MKLKEMVRDIPDFPKPGILFADITPILADGELFAEVIDALSALVTLSGANKILAIESRGFIFGAPVARDLALPLIPVRKPGKLPAKVVRVEYALEYGTDTLEMHADALSPGDRVVVIDDLLATGGTAEAACILAEGQGADVVSLLFLIELPPLGGRARLSPRAVSCLVTC